MDAVNVSDIKDQIESLIGRAEAGESVEITRDGHAVARIMPPEPPADAKKRIDWKEVLAFTRTLPFDPSSAGELVRRMRDESRY